MKIRDRSTWFKKVADNWGIMTSAPDFWPLVWVFIAFMVAFTFFFTLAIGFDMMASIYARWRGACRKLGDWEAFMLFISPFAICLASMFAAGEFIHQLERRNRFKRPMNWPKILGGFGFACGLLLAAGVMMVIWC